MLKPSPKLLIHEVTWKRRTQPDDGPFSEPSTVDVTLSKVRISMGAEGVGYSIQGTQKEQSTVLFYFPNLSRMDGAEGIPALQFGEQVIFSGQPYVIKQILSIYDSDRLHHLEVTLE